MSEDLDNLGDLSDLGGLHGLDRLNNLSAQDACTELGQCCGSKSWARQLADRRPFGDLSELEEFSQQVWWELDEADWLEAFRCHPKIGENKAAAVVSATSHEWSEEEQSGIRTALEDALAELAAANHEYEAKFGYIFIVCATGQSAEDMLVLLKRRIENEPDAELRVAAHEQGRITQLRLRKLVAS